MKTGNKGEWSELYTFFKILADGKLFPGDAYLNINSQHYYPVIEILRKEQGLEKSYKIVGSDVIINAQSSENVIPISSFEAAAKELLNTIKMSSGTFEAPDAKHFLKTIGGVNIKADSNSKADITIQIHDSRTNLQPILGFSIKSKLGSPSTLLNASRTTNFIFKIAGKVFSDEEVAVINNIGSKSKIKDTIQSIYAQGGTLSLSGFENNVFKNNLTLIDSCLTEILGYSLKLFYHSGISSMAALTAQLERDNPLNFDQSSNHKFYSYKIKRFLSEIALGMMPNKVWDGKYNSTEGYIIVKTDGELVCYHITERDLFEEYLLANTRLDTPSSSRHGFAKVYKDGSEQFIKLNLQIRFI